METDKKNKRSKLLYAGVITVLILFFIIGFAYGLNSVLKMEGNFPPENLTEGKTSEEEIRKDPVKYLNGLISAAETGKPQFSSDAAFDIDEDSLVTDGSDTVKLTMNYIRDDLNDHLNDSFEQVSRDFGEDFSAILRTPAITSADVEDCIIDYRYYKCSACGETSDKQESSCEACGSEYPYLLQYRDDYTITYQLKVTDGVLKNSFPVHSDADMQKLIGDDIENILSLGKTQVDYTGLALRVQVDRITDEIKRLTYIKNMTVSANGDFIGDCSALGALSLSVNVTETENYGFTWPSISLSAHSKDVEPKEKDNLLATLVFPDAKQDGVEWISSDPDIVSVDDDGYFTAGKNAGTATITATYIYDDKPYTDSCVVNVKYDVESISLNKRKLSMNQGDTFTFAVSFSPKKATIQTVKWYSDDENIAKVDENGVVTAVSPGVVRVYALSDDLYYRASCEVTVHE